MAAKQPVAAFFIVTGLTREYTYPFFFTNRVKIVHLVGKKKQWLGIYPC